jgi:hypothetical protein
LPYARKSCRGGNNERKQWAVPLDLRFS